MRDVWNRREYGRLSGWYFDVHRLKMEGILVDGHVKDRGQGWMINLPVAVTLEGKYPRSNMLLF